MLDRLIDRIADRVVEKLEARKPQPLSAVFNVTSASDPEQFAADVAHRMARSPGIA